MQTPFVLYNSFTLAGMPRRAPVSPFWERLTEMIGKDIGVKQRVVAKTFKVGQSAVTKWKTGKDLPGFNRAVEMAEEFGVCVEWLLTGRGLKYPAGTNDRELSRLLSLWSSLPPNLKGEVIDFAHFKRQTARDVNDLTRPEPPSSG